MKKLFIIAVMAVAAITANAEKQESGTFSIMPRVGVGMSIFNDCYVGIMSAAYTGTDKVSNNMCLGIGAEFTYQASDIFAVSAGLDYDWYSSSDKKINNEDVTVRFGYLDIPVMAHLTFGGFGIGAGVQPGFKLSASCGNSDLGGDIKSTVFSVPVEVAYTFGHNVIGLRYNIPLTKAYEYPDQNPKISGVMLSYGYRFDL